MFLDGRVRAAGEVGAQGTMRIPHIHRVGRSSVGRAHDVTADGCPENRGRQASSCAARLRRTALAGGWQGFWHGGPPSRRGIPWHQPRSTDRPEASRAALTSSSPPTTSSISASRPGCCAASAGTPPTSPRRPSSRWPRSARSASAVRRRAHGCADARAGRARSDGQSRRHVGGPPAHDRSQREGKRACGAAASTSAWTTSWRSPCCGPRSRRRSPHGCRRRAQRGAAHAARLTSTAGARVSRASARRGGRARRPPSRGRRSWSASRGAARSRSCPPRGRPAAHR